MDTIAHMWTLSFCCVASGIKFRSPGLEAGSLSHLAGLPSAFASLKLVLIILEKKNHKHSLCFTTLRYVFFTTDFFFSILCV